MSPVHYFSMYHLKMGFFLCMVTCLSYKILKYERKQLDLFRINGYLVNYYYFKHCSVFQKGGLVWTVFCVHDDTEPYLEIYTDTKVATSHKPEWFMSLASTVHISPTICATDDEFDFVITLADDVVRLTTPTW